MKYYHFVISDNVEVCIIASNVQAAISIFRHRFGELILDSVIKIL